MEHAIKAEGLVKTYPKEVKALDGLSFAVAPGSVFALLGPNGAGKSTAVKILTTLTTPNAGRATVAGLEVGSRRMAGHPEGPGHPLDLLRGEAVDQVEAPEEPALVRRHSSRRRGLS